MRNIIASLCAYEIRKITLISEFRRSWPIFARTKSWDLLCAMAFFCGAVLVPQVSNAQVAMTLEGQVIYDDNVYLEDGNGLPSNFRPTVVVDPDGVERTLPVPEDADGKRNSDMLYYAGVSLSSDLPISSYLKSGARVKGGFLFFTDQSEANRLLLDSDLSIASESNLIPDPYKVALSSHLSATAYQVAVPQGATGRNSLTHDADLSFTLGEHKLAEQTSLLSDYRVQRHDYIGELRIGGSNDLGVKQEGADWFSNRINLSLKQDISDFFNASIGVYGDLKNFTSSNQVGVEGSLAKELDRFDYGTSVRGDYTISEKVDSSAGIGVDLVHYIDTPPVSQSQQNDEASLSFFGNLSYRVLQYTTASCGLGQSVSTDIEGGRVVGRDIFANLQHTLDEYVRFVVGGKYGQYSNETSLSSSTDRFEGSVSVDVTVIPNVKASLGYAYAVQNAGSGLDVSNLNSDYKDNKIFIGLSTDLVGVPY